MATTSPDNLYSPDSSDPYALTQDLGAMQDSVQSALVRRANSYTGTTTQMNATSAPNGSTWWNTTNSTKYWMDAGSWQVYDTGWHPGTLSPSFSGYLHHRRIGDTVSVRFSVQGSVPGSGTVTELLSVALPDAARPTATSSGIVWYRGYTGGAFVRQDGTVGVIQGSGVNWGAGYPLQGTITYLK